MHDEPVSNKAAASPGDKPTDTGISRPERAGESPAGQQEPKARPGHGHAGAWIFVALLVAAGAVGGWYWWAHLRNAAAQAQASATAAVKPPEVTIANPLKQRVVEWDEFTGQFAAVDYVEIRARVSGYLDSIGFQDGQPVKKGDILFVIDPRPYQASLDSAKAALADALAKQELANIQLERAKELRQTGNVAVAILDQRNQETRSAAAGIELAKANIQTAQLNLEFCTIRAPISGRISRHEVSIGNLISGGDAGTTLLTTIVSLDPIHFHFDMSESDYLAYERVIASGKMHSLRKGGVLVEAHLPDEKEWSLKGKLDFVDNQVNRASGTIRGRGIFANPSSLVTPGQFGRIRIPGSEPYEALLVPDAAVLTDQSRKIVLTVKDDGTVEAKTVRTGFSRDGLRVIRDGLSESDRVIINGIIRARAGSKVTPQPGEIKPDPTAG